MARVVFFRQFNYVNRQNPRGKGQKGDREIDQSVMNMIEAKGQKTQNLAREIIGAAAYYYRSSPERINVKSFENPK